MFDFLLKAYFLFTKLDIGIDEVKKLINLNVTVKIYEVDKLNCKDGTIHFVPLRCVHHSHEEFISE